MNHSRPPDVLLEDLFPGSLPGCCQIEVPKVSTQTELEPVDLSKYTFAPECDRCGAEATIIGQGCAGLLASGPLAGGRQTVIRSHLRLVACVCVLTAGLLMGGAGGAVAVADPGSSGTAAHGDDGTNTSGQGSSTATRPVGNVSDTPRKRIQGVTSTLGSGRKPGQQPSTGSESPKSEFGGTGSKDEKKDSGGQSGQQPSTGTESPENQPGGTEPTDETNDSGIVAAVPDPVAAVTNVVAPVPNDVAPVTTVAPVPDVVAPVTTVAPVPDVVAPVTTVAPVPDVVAPVTTVVPVPDVVAPVTTVAPVPNLVAPVSDVIALIQDMLASDAGAVVPLTQLQSDLSSLLGIAGVAPVPNLVVPVSDVIALIQDKLASVAGAVVPLTQLQSALYSFLLGIAGVEPVVAGVGGVAGAGLSPAAGASVASQLLLDLVPAGIPGVPRGLPLAGIPGVPLAGNAATGVATLDVAVGRASALPAMAPPAPNGAIPMGEQSFFRDACELLLHASLWALAAVALPGVGGLAVFTAAGVRVGYVQAKAGFVLRAAGIARFAGPGPLGVVRSGSLIGVRPRALRVVRPGALSAC
jgi:hypothetical protein